MSNKELLFSFFYTLFKRKYLFLSLFTGTLTGILLATYITPPLYKATTKIFIHTNPKLEIALFEDLTTPGERDTKTGIGADIVQILSSEEMAREIVQEFQLDKALRRISESPEELRDQIVYYVKKTIKIPKKLLVLVGILEEKEKNYTYAAIRKLIEDMSDIKVEQDTKVINLSVWARSPQQSVSIANGMAEKLAKKTLVLNTNQIENTYAYALSEAQRAKDELKQLQETLAEFKTKNSIVQISEDEKVKINRMDKFETEFASVSTQQEEVEKKILETKNQLKKQDEKILTEFVETENPMIMEIKSNLRALESKLASILEEKTSKHPDALKLTAEIEENKRKLGKEVIKITQSETFAINPIYQDLMGRLVSLYIEKEALNAKKVALQLIITKLRDELNKLPEKEQELASLTNLVSIKEEIYKTLKSKLEKLYVLKRNQVNEYGLTVISKADTPSGIDPQWPDWDISMYIGIPMSLTFALGIIFFIEYWNGSLRTAREIESTLKVPVVGCIPDIKENIDTRRL